MSTTIRKKKVHSINPMNELPKFVLASEIKFSIRILATIVSVLELSHIMDTSGNEKHVEHKNSAQSLLITFLISITYLT